MKAVAGLITLLMLIINFPVFCEPAYYNRTASYDELDPRLPDHRLNLLHRLQVSSGNYLSTDFDCLADEKLSGFNYRVYAYLEDVSPYRFNYKTDDFRFSAGLKIKEDWLGAVEGDSGIGNLQSVFTIRGKAVIKDKIEIYQDITLFRYDKTSYLDSASTTGEFLKDPLLSYQLPHRGPVASKVDVLEVQTDRAFVKFNLFGVDIQSGRDRLQLKGGYRTGLLFSGLTRPIDMYYRLDYKFWRFDFTALSGQLTDAGKRYISAKRLALRLARNLQIGVTEAAAFADDPAAYINPLMLFYITHRHRPNNRDNIIAMADVSYTPFKNLNLYGEFLDDDLIIFEGGASKYGFLLGLFKSRLFSERTDLHLEYSHVRKWTYTHVSEVNAWEYRGQPFGFWAGPDADEFYAQLSYLFSPSSAIKMNFDYIRKGEGDLFHPHEAEGGNKSPAFPSGTVEKSAGAWLDLRHEYSRFILNSRFGYRQIENRHNSPADFDNYFAHIVVIYNL